MCDIKEMSDFFLYAMLGCIGMGGVLGFIIGVLRGLSAK